MNTVIAMSVPIPKHEEIVPARTTPFLRTLSGMSGSSAVRSRAVKNPQRTSDPTNNESSCGDVHA